MLGDADIPLSPGSFFNRTLWLRAGNEITPDRAVLYYRTYEHPYGVVSLIDGNTLRNKLAPNKADVTLTLEVGRSFLKNEGLVGSSEGPGHEEFHSREVSAQFGFAVHGGFPAGTHWQQFKARATMTTGSLLLVGLLTGGIVHWSMVRYRREDLPA
ncbi:CSS motif domain associated with EAL [compost metagenome]